MIANIFTAAALVLIAIFVIVFTICMICMYKHDTKADEDAEFKLWWDSLENPNFFDDK